MDQRVTFRARARELVRHNASSLLAVGLALLLLQDIFGTHGVLAMRRSQREVADIEKEIQQLNEENRQLQERVRDLKTDPAAIERIAREEMGLAKPGELIFKLPVKSGEATTSPDTASPAHQSTPNR